MVFMWLVNVGQIEAKSGGMSMTTNELIESLRQYVAESRSTGDPYMIDLMVDAANELVFLARELKFTRNLLDIRNGVKNADSK